MSIDDFSRAMERAQRSYDRQEPPENFALAGSEEPTLAEHLAGFLKVADDETLLRAASLFVQQMDIESWADFELLKGWIREQEI